MRFKNNDQRTSLFWLAIGLIIAYFSTKYGLGRISAPGPGLFPFLSGLAIALLALIVFSQQFSITIKENFKALWLDTKWPTIIIVLGALVLYVVLFRILGFILDTFWFIAFLMRAIEPISWKKVLFGSILTSLSSYVIFQLWLEAQLPKGIFGF